MPMRIVPPDLFGKRCQSAGEQLMLATSVNPSPLLSGIASDRSGSCPGFPTGLPTAADYPQLSPNNFGQSGIPFIPRTNYNNYLFLDSS
jgi:hypothetical protein